MMTVSYYCIRKKLYCLTKHYISLLFQVPANLRAYIMRQVLLVFSVVLCVFICCVISSHGPIKQGYRSLLKLKKTITICWLSYMVLSHSLRRK
uniref:Uncharacterized protein n=1 Tax=Parascaris univalens TaxID=6257 RepID=A0A914ZXU4_PARUN